jgi:two-component system response regulator AtoC
MRDARRYGAGMAEPGPRELAAGIDDEHLAEMMADADEVSQGSLIGGSKARARVRDMIKRVSPGKTTILVRGESGTGKELVARAIHAASERASGPLVVIHCAALPDTLLESELFGYEKGAFTGAAARKLGRVERASGGALFLDEIGDVTPAMQVKLLRLLQERTFERLGGHEPIAADVRFVAATHRDLDGMVKRGEFREDLFYRLNVVPVWVPPLRARRHDVEQLAVHFCRGFAEEAGKTRVALDEEALARIRSERWPGNVRQLQNFIERLVVLSDDAPIDVQQIAAQLGGASPFVTEATEGGTRAERTAQQSQALRRSVAMALGRGSLDTADVLPLDEQLRDAERAAIEQALAAAAGNRSKAARLLGVSRQTLYNKLKEHGLGARGK